MIDPGLSSPSDFSIADNINNNEFASSCESGFQPFGKKSRRKRETDGTCDSDDPPRPDDAAAATEYPDQGVTGGTDDFQRTLTQSYLNIARTRASNPCVGTGGSYPLCCLGPRDPAELLNVLRCDLLFSIAECRAHFLEGAAIYCCFGVYLESPLKWGMKGLACPASIEV